MADMKALTVGGVTYNIKDAGAVHTPETAQVGQTLVVSALDENGKPAVWECADFPSGGSSVLIVTVENDVASHSSAEIHAHVQAGGTVALLYYGIYFTPSAIRDYLTYFVAMDEAYDQQVIIVNDDASVEYYSNTLACAENIIPTPTTAEVGQTIVVKSVDENGKPTKWEAADFPSDEHINSLIDAKLGVIENGTY